MSSEFLAEIFDAVGLDSYVLETGSGMRLATASLKICVPKKLVRPTASSICLIFMLDVQIFFNDADGIGMLETLMSSGGRCDF